MSEIHEWWCGGCGSVHGWSCPFFGNPGARLTSVEIAEIQQRVEEARKTGKLMRVNPS